LRIRQLEFEAEMGQEISRRTTSGPTVQRCCPSLSTQHSTPPPTTPTNAAVTTATMFAGRHAIDLVPFRTIARAAPRASFAAAAAATRVSSDAAATGHAVDGVFNKMRPSERVNAARRVPMHLTMTLEELLAKNDTTSTHRLVQRAAAQARSAATDAAAQRHEIDAIFEMMEVADSLKHELSDKRVPMHLTMTLEELLAKNDTPASHRLTVGAQARSTATDAATQQQAVDMLFDTMMVGNPLEVKQQASGVQAIFDRMANVDALACELAAKQSEPSWRDARAEARLSAHTGL
jgi:hypothetical protein